MNEKMKSGGFICFLACGLLCSSYLVAHSSDYAIVDTGQTSCYDNDGTQIDCSVPGEPFYGQDAQSEGNQFSYTDNGDGTVTDNVTGLMWQQTPSRNGFTYEEAKEYSESLELGGYDDWRLPTTKELFSISDFSQGWPYLNTIYFDLAGETVSKDEQFWTEYYLGITTEAGSPAAFGVNHGTGHIKAYPAGGARAVGDMRDSDEPPSLFLPPAEGDVPGDSVINPADNYVRAVRGNTTYGLNQFEANGDGTVTDHATGLMWQQDDSVDGMDWETALAYAEDATIAGYDDWRLPNVKELQSILDYTHSPSAFDTANLGPAIDTTIFMISELPQGTTAYYPDYGYFWSSTSAYFGGDSTEYYYAWYVAFGTAVDDDGNDTHGAGAVRFDTKYEGGPLGEGGERFFNYVRLVRNDQSVGDLNQDGIVDQADVSVLKQYIRQLSETCEECDLDGDGSISVRDARKLISLCTCSGCSCDE